MWCTVIGWGWSRPHPVEVADSGARRPLLCSSLSCPPPPWWQHLCPNFWGLLSLKFFPENWTAHTQNRQQPSSIYLFRFIYQPIIPPWHPPDPPDLHQQHLLLPEGPGRGTQGGGGQPQYSLQRGGTLLSTPPMEPFRPKRPSSNTWTNSSSQRWPVPAMWTFWSRFVTTMAWKWT